MQSRVPVLYLAPWVDYGGTDKGTIDWFRWLDRDRFEPSLVTTQPSANRRLSEVVPYAGEVWNLPDMLRGEEFPLFILDFIHSRGVRVLHLMNSRLGFDLLPDLRALPRPPAVVVQLHVEEEDRSGYVRYVTTRYGNLVDAFSVTSRHLAESIMSDYDVPRGKCHVIYTGVDADAEFSPLHVPRLKSLGGEVTHILYPGRLVEQKDPLLMVEIATKLRERGLAFRIHSIGEGPLESDIRKVLSQRGLEEHDDLATVQRFADRAILLEAGEIVEMGRPETVVREYQRRNREREQGREVRAWSGADRSGDGSAEIVEAWFESERGERTDSLKQGGSRSLSGSRCSSTMTWRIRFSDLMCATAIRTSLPIPACGADNRRAALTSPRVVPS